MCIMCVIKPSHDFNPEYIETMYSKGNNDGFGLAYVEGERYEEGENKGKLVRPGRIKTIKTMGGPEEIKRIYSEHKGKYPIVMHLRNATQGDKTVENCHPYKILDIDDGDKIDLVMFHNGTIRNVQINPAWSDSRNFAEVHLRGLLRSRPSMLYEESFRYVLCSLIDTNKLIFMDNRERVTVINYEQGSIHPPTGVWLSTKENITLPKAPAPPRERSHMGFHGNGNSRTAESISSTYDGNGKVVKFAWTHPDGSKWTMGSDGRSHYIPPGVDIQKSAPKLPVVGANKIEDLLEKFGNEPQDKDLELLCKELHSKQQLELFNYVTAHPVKSAYLIKHLAATTNMLPEFKNKSIEELVEHCIQNAWLSGFALAITRNKALPAKEPAIYEVN